jgi:hypothetical protein
MYGEEEHNKPAAKAAGYAGEDVVVPASVVSAICTAQVQIAKIQAEAAVNAVSALTATLERVAKLAWSDNL